MVLPLKRLYKGMLFRITEKRFPLKMLKLIMTRMCVQIDNDPHVCVCDQLANLHSVSSVPRCTHFICVCVRVCACVRACANVRACVVKQSLVYMLEGKGLIIHVALATYSFWRLY